MYVCVIQVPISVLPILLLLTGKSSENTSTAIQIIIYIFHENKVFKFPPSIMKKEQLSKIKKVYFSVYMLLDIL
jgi:hypothetical protein